MKKYCEICNKLKGENGKIYIAGTICEGHWRTTDEVFGKPDTWSPEFKEAYEKELKRLKK